MKSKKIDRLKYEDYTGTEILMNFFTILETLNIKSATEQANQASITLDEDFCSKCKSTKDDCDCHHEPREYDWDDDGDRAYDSWKDAQLENED